MGRSAHEVEVAPTAAALMDAAGEMLVGAAAEAIRTSGRFTLALSGGSTPKTLYALLATPRYAPRIDWARTHVFFGDERCVPPDDPSSNHRMAREALLDRVPLPPVNVHPIRGEDDPAAAAAAYERELRTVFATPAGAPRPRAGARFDLVLLGMGDNGHTASLFPNLRAVRETERWVMAEYVAEVSMWRVTLTPVVLNAAATAAFLVSGRDKAPMLHRVLEGPVDIDALPAQAIAPADGRLRWLVDAPAAAELARR